MRFIIFTIEHSEFQDIGDLTISEELAATIDPSWYRPIAAHITGYRPEACLLVHDDDPAKDLEQLIFEQDETPDAHDVFDSILNDGYEDPLYDDAGYSVLQPGECSCGCGVIYGEIPF